MDLMYLFDPAAYFHLDLCTLDFVYFRKISYYSGGLKYESYSIG